MMQQACSLWLLLAVLQLVASQYEECYNPNEVLVESINPCNTCEERGYCPRSETGCDCAPGFYRDRRGDCVPPRECDEPPTYVLPRSYGPTYNRPVQPPRPRCKANEEYSDCGTSCPPTCLVRAPVCNYQCVPGCFCRRGYVRNTRGVCIPPGQCPTPPPVCGTNEVYSVCGSACPPTCERRQPICTAQCVRGCFCRAGYIRKSGVCVPIQDCNPYRAAPPPPPTVQTPVYPNPPTVRPPTQGCPDRRKCVAFCKSINAVTGFCIGEGFRECSCRG